MNQYINTECPVCGKLFVENDDIVVCPECGTPHHRDCYKENGKCFNSEKHGSYEWSLVIPIHKDYHPSSNSSQHSDVCLCPMCGDENAPGSHYCHTCGAHLLQSHQNQSEIQKNFVNERERVYAESFEGEDFNGISAHEAAEFVGSNSSYFLPRFKAFANGSKIIPNLSAFLFTHYYLLFRKMYSLGIILFLFDLIISVPEMLLDFTEIQKIYIQNGLLSQMIFELPNVDTIRIFAVVSSLIQWAIRILMLLFFNRLYYIKTVSSVKGIKKGLESANSYTPAMFHEFMKNKGGINIIMPLIFIGVVFAISIGISFYIISSPYFVLPDILMKS